MLQREEEEQRAVQAFEEAPAPQKQEQKTVRQLVKELEQSLDINHFLNTKFHRQNHGLCEKLIQERAKEANLLVRQKDKNEKKPKPEPVNPVNGNAK
ncbi:hypothetical protein NEDG_01979 [Nematocida displodere]|uniref:Uncharacterized protein n=1 Tax=Nematocida displodere TaxID=1805483 RepID=A0A177EEQ2_9MICR|nr:hypothetical protein NEDG_01979 [Nematocida displodere]